MRRSKNSGETEHTVQPGGKYRIAHAARLMGISRSCLYNYIKDNTVRSHMDKIFEGEEGKCKFAHYILGKDIMSFNMKRIYTPIC